MFKYEYCYNLYLMFYRCSIYGYLNLNICWGYFILVFYFTALYAFLMFYQSVSHVVVETSSCSPHSLLIISSRIS